MEIEDFDGHCTINCVADLNHRLQSVRKGDDGAFVLCHDADGPMLLVHINGNAAFLGTSLIKKANTPVTFRQEWHLTAVRKTSGSCWSEVEKRTPFGQFKIRSFPLTRRTKPPGTSCTSQTFPLR